MVVELMSPGRETYPRRTSWRAEPESNVSLDTLDPFAAERGWKVGSEANSGRSNSSFEFRCCTDGSAECRWFDGGQLAPTVREIIRNGEWRFSKFAHAAMIRWSLGKYR